MMVVVFTLSGASQESQIVVGLLKPVLLKTTKFMYYVFNHNFYDLVF